MTTPTDIRHATDVIQVLLDDPNVHLVEGASSAHLNEILYVLDDLRYAHEELDKLNVPRDHPELGELNLRLRIRWLVVNGAARRLKDIPRKFTYVVSNERASQPRLLEVQKDHDASSVEGVIEVRIRFGVQSWMDIPASEWLCDSAEEANAFTRVLLRNTPGAIELRWNWHGSLQGHYVNH